MLIWLWTEAWTATHFCKVRMRLNRSIAASLRRSSSSAKLFGYSTRDSRPIKLETQRRTDQWE
jgi:hypothetical protein